MEKVFQIFMLSIFLLFLTACYQGNKTILIPEDAVTVHLNKDPSIRIMVKSDDYKNKTWYRIFKNGSVEVIKNIPDVSLYDISQIKISPQDKYMAVLSAGEGHPLVDIFETKKILLQQDGLEGAVISPILTVNPYPGGIWINRWETDTLLLVDSDMPLDQKEKMHLLQEPESETHTFSWNILTGEIKRK